MLLKKYFLRDDYLPNIQHIMFANSKKPKIKFTNKEITPWGGLVLMKNMLNKMDFSKIIESCPALP